MLRNGGEERRGRHVCSGGIRQHCWEDCTSLPCTGVSSAKPSPAAPAQPLFCCNSLSPAPSQADTNSHHRIRAGTSPKPSWEPVPSTAQRNETILHLCPQSLAGAGQERVNDAWDSCSLWHTLCCLLAPVSKLVKLVSFVRTKINSHRFSTLS